MTSAGSIAAPLLSELAVENSAFSSTSPGLQLAVDSHSLGAFKTCPRWYYLTIIRGMVPQKESVHLTFGLLLHRASEHFHHQRAAGASFEEALESTVADLLEATYSTTLRRPWLSEDPNKNRLTLLRSIVWYLDKYADDSMETIRLADGTAAVELHFDFDSGFTTRCGEPWRLCGWMDRLAEFGGEVYSPDLKTTKNTLSQNWFDSFTPGNQFSMYTLAGQVAFKTPTRGVVIDGVQVLVGGSRFGRQIAPRPQPILDEWLAATGKWLQKMEDCAQEGAAREAIGGDPSAAWEMNDSDGACSRYGGCPARGICSRSPAAREQWTASGGGWKRKVWNPLRERTDI